MEDSEVCDSWEQEDNSDILEKRLEKLRLQKGARAQVQVSDPSQVDVDFQSSADGSSRLEGDAGGFPQIRILSRNEVKLEMEKTKKSSQSPVQVVLDSTTQESLRTQYVPPEPKLKILSRPKGPNADVNGSASKNKKAQVTKTLQQREQEYAEARMRILGDVRFHEEEHEAALEASLSPAEILKLKISEAMQNEPGMNNTPPPVVPLSARSDSSGISGTSGLSDSDATNSTTPSGSTSSSKSKKKRNKANVERVPIPTPLKDFPLSKTESDRIVRQPRGPDADGSPGFALRREF